MMSGNYGDNTNREFLVGKFGYSLKHIGCPIKTAIGTDGVPREGIECAETFDDQFDGHEIGLRVSEDEAKEAWLGMRDDLSPEAKAYAADIAAKLGWL